MIKSKFRTMVISPMLQGMNILRTQGTLDMGDVPKSALQERAMPSVMVKMPTRNIQQRCGKILLMQAKNPFEKNKRRLCTAGVAIQERNIYYTIFVCNTQYGLSAGVKPLLFSG